MRAIAKGQGDLRAFEEEDGITLKYDKWVAAGPGNIHHQKPTP